MKPIPYSVDEFKPWDFHFAQRIAVLEDALRQVIEIVGTFSPAMQDSLGKVLQQMDQGGEVANEMAVTSTLVTHGHQVLPHLYQDQPLNQAVSQLMHTLGLIPQVRQRASPLALPKTAFYDIDAAFCHTEPKAAELAPRSLEQWYQNLIWEGHSGKHVQLVTNATIFHPKQQAEHAIIISLWHLQPPRPIALVILPDYPRVQFLNMVPVYGGNSALVVSTYSHLQALSNGRSHDEILDNLRTVIAQSLFAHLPPDVVSLCGSETDPTESREALMSWVEALRLYPPSETPATPTIGLKQWCSVRRGQRDPIGTFTSFVLEAGEVIFRDDQPDKIYVVTSSKERVELLEDDIANLPYVSLHLLAEGLQKALFTFQGPPEAIVPKHVVDDTQVGLGNVAGYGEVQPAPGIMEFHETPSTAPDPAGDLPNVTNA